MIGFLSCLKITDSNGFFVEMLESSGISIFTHFFRKHFCFWKKAKEDSMAMDIARKLSGDPGKQERRAYVKNKDLPGLASNNSRRKNN